MNSLTINLAKLRKAKGLTQSEFGKAIGIEKRNISHYETGRSLPNINVIKNIAKYFGVSIDYLVEYEHD